MSSVIQYLLLLCVKYELGSSDIINITLRKQFIIQAKISSLLKVSKLDKTHLIKIFKYFKVTNIYPKNFLNIIKN